MFIQTVDKKKALWFECDNNLNNNKSVLFLTGFPKYPWNTKFVDLFVRHWYNVLCPMYSWTFESNWRFSIEESVLDIKLRYEFLSKWIIDLDILWKEKKKYNIEEIILCWISYWWYILALFLDNYKAIKTQKAFFISMLGYWFINKNNPSFIEWANNSKKLLEIAFPFSYRLKDINKFFNQIKWVEKINIEQDKTLNCEIKKILIHWKNDLLTPINISEYYFKNHDNCILNPIDWWHASKMDMAEIENLIHKFS